MNPNRKFKNHGPDAGVFAVLMVAIFAVVLCVLVLNPIHAQNIQKLKSSTHSTAPWTPEQKGQEYNLKHGDWVFFWKSDEKPVRVGMVYVLWGYYRIIAHKDGMTEFRDVEWCNANF